MDCQRELADFYRPLTKIDRFQVQDQVAQRQEVAEAGMLFLERTSWSSLLKLTKSEDNLPNI